MNSRFASALLLVVALASIAHGAETKDASANTYKLENGPFTVRVVETVTLNDAARKKDLQLRIHHPEGAGAFPVIVWSHGALGSKDDYTPLMAHWASHGYVTIQANHSDSRKLGVRPTDTTKFQDWRSRPGDVSFIFDSLGTLEEKEPGLKARLDKNRLGIGGHSFGANTAQLVGGAQTRPGAGEKSLADARVSAVMLLSGQGPGEMLTEQSWAKFSKPLFVMTGSADGPTRTGQPAVWRKKPYELSPPGDKFLVWVEGLDHGFGGVTGVSFNSKLTPNAEHVAITKIATVAFWDAYLKQSTNALAYLKSGKLRAFSKNTTDVQHK